jgi:trk system potassium uptake protein TrkA
VAEVDAPKTFWEKSLADLALRTEYGVTILAIRRASKGERSVIVVNPSGAEVIREGDILVVIGENVNLGKLSAAGE